MKPAPHSKGTGERRRSRNDALPLQRLPRVKPDATLAKPCAKASAELTQIARSAPKIPSRDLNHGERPAGAAAVGNVADERRELIALLEQLPKRQIVKVMRAVKEVVAEKDSPPRPCAKSGQGRRAMSATSGTDNPDALPELPRGLAWPEVLYADWRKEHSGGIVAFLRDETVGWSKLLKAGFNELRFLRLKDPTAIVAVENYTRRVPGLRDEPRPLPEDVRFLPRKEANDRYVADHVPEIANVRDNLRVLKLLASRIKRGADPL